MSRFEESFAAWLGVRWAFAFWKGRVALYAILKAMGVGEGDEIILPGFTCVMNVNPIMYVGAKPVYVDIEPVTYNLDADLLAERITPATKVIIAQHTFGFPCRMDRIMDIAARHHVPVIEDCCLALGSTFQGRRCGTFGVAAYWSFQWSKPFTTGLGGMAATDDAQLTAKLEALCRESLVRPPAKLTAALGLQRLAHRLLFFPRTAAAITAIFRCLTRKGMVVGSSSADEFAPTMADDFFMGMGPGQQRAGLRQVRKLDKDIAHRRRMRALYDELLAGAGFEVAPPADDSDPVLVRYPVRVADKARAVAEAPRRFVELGTWFECPLHPIETPMHLYDYHEGMCPVAEKACREVVNLPMHRRASEATARRSAAFIAGIGPAEAAPGEPPPEDAP